MEKLSKNKKIIILLTVLMYMKSVYLIISHNYLNLHCSSAKLTSKRKHQAHLSRQNPEKNTKSKSTDDHYTAAQEVDAVLYLIIQYSGSSS